MQPKIFHSSFKKMSAFSSFFYFFVAGIDLLLVTRVLIPFVSSRTTWHPLLLWILFAGGLVFLPLFIAGLIFYRHEENAWHINAFFARYRLYPLDKKDRQWAAAGAVAIMGLTMGILQLSTFLHGRMGTPELETTPPFLQFDPLVGSQRWLLLPWLIMFFFNIFGEEILWRGYILPRQEATLGTRAWMVNSLYWLVFHLAFGWQLLIVLLPIVIILPYIVSKRQNTTIGILLHAVLNGPMFILISLGILKQG